MPNFFQFCIKNKHNTRISFEDVNWVIKIYQFCLTLYSITDVMQVLHTQILTASIAPDFSYYRNKSLNFFDSQLFQKWIFDTHSFGILNRGSGSCSRLGAQFIIEAKILGAQSHHSIYQWAKYWVRKGAPLRIRFRRPC